MRTRPEPVGRVPSPGATGFIRYDGSGDVTSLVVARHRRNRSSAWPGNASSKKAIAPARGKPPGSAVRAAVPEEAQRSGFGPNRTIQERVPAAPLLQYLAPGNCQDCSSGSHTKKAIHLA